jgi:hypothetical protein
MSTPSGATRLRPVAQLRNAGGSRRAFEAARIDAGAELAYRYECGGQCHGRRKRVAPEGGNRECAEAAAAREFGTAGGAREFGTAGGIIGRMVVMTRLGCDLAVNVQRTVAMLVRASALVPMAHRHARVLVRRVLLTGGRCMDVRRVQNERSHRDEHDARDETT